MAEFVLARTQRLPRPVAEAFSFFADAGNLERITPPQLHFHILTPQPIAIEKGTLIDYRLRLNGIPINWRTEITNWDPPFEFVDTQLRGPYKQWIHLHSFSENPDGTTEMKDEVRYRLPFEPLGDLAHFIIRKQLDNIFDYRYQVIEEIFGK
jgi:ligand-binding SRPBCC domain-containing protein